MNLTQAPQASVPARARRARRSRFLAPLAGRARLLVATALVAVSLPSAAAAQTITGGATEVTLEAAPTLTGLGLSFETFGTASATTDAAGLPVASFLITGGTRDPVTGALLVRHDGSGLLFTAGSSSLSIGDFLIDSAAGLVTANAFANGTGLGSVPVFNIGANLSLLLTQEAAGAFTSVFGAPDLSGARIGTADINAVTAAVGVPEPATWALMISGFALAGGALRRRRRVAAFA